MPPDDILPRLRALRASAEDLATRIRVFTEPHTYDALALEHRLQAALILRQDALAVEEALVQWVLAVLGGPVTELPRRPAPLPPWPWQPGTDPHPHP